MFFKLKVGDEADKIGNRPAAFIEKCSETCGV